MKWHRREWADPLKRAVYVGSVASAVSSAVIANRSAADSVSAASGTNSTSHWLWGERAQHQSDVSARYTGVGYLIHHASSIFWAVFYEHFFPSRRGHVAATVGSAAAVAALAAATDYLLTPPRLRPGFERHLSLPSMVFVYAGFAAGLAAGRYLWRRRHGLA
jgi:hypothetical protein